MATLPASPFCSAASSDAVEEAVATQPPSSPVATADLYGVGPLHIAVVQADNERMRAVLADNERRFVLNDDAFMAELDPPPLFLQQPSHLRARDIFPILKLLAGY